MGTVVLLIGVLFLLENLGYFYIGNIWLFSARFPDSRGRCPHSRFALIASRVLWGALIAGVGADPAGK